MQVEVVKQGQIWQYNPLSEGYTDDDVFNTISGTPAISSNKLRLNAAVVQTYDKRFQNGSLEMLITIPVAPTSGDIRSFGLKNNDNKGAMLFDIADAVFSAKAYDAGGTLIDTFTINWDTDWSATEARYRISWGRDAIVFAIDDTIVARLDTGEYGNIATDDVLSRQPINIYLNNTNSDNMDISLINFS